MKIITTVSALVVTLGCMPGAWAQGQQSPPSGQRGPRHAAPGRCAQGWSSTT